MPERRGSRRGRTRIGKRRLIPVLGWTTGAALVFLLVWQQVSVDRLVVQFDRETNRNRHLETEVNAISLEVNRLSSLGLVEDRASNELGLIRPRTEQIVTVLFEAGEEDGGQFAWGGLVPDAYAAPRKDAR